MSPRRRQSVTASPVLIGAVTTLVTVVAVFLSYNANSGLPFVPTYDVSVTVPDAAGLVKGNEVRVGGKRAGVIDSIVAEAGSRGRPRARLSLKLEQGLGPIRDDSIVTVRPRSPLGLKYLELQEGERGRDIRPGGELPPTAAGTQVELDEVVNTLDAETRRNSRTVLESLGNGLAGRGADVNELLVQAPPLLRGLERVAANLSRPGTGLSGLLRGLDATLTELAPVSRELGRLVASADRTAGALSEARAELAEAIGETPPTQAAAIDALGTARPVLSEARSLVADLRSGVRLLPLASERLHLALEAGTPVLRRSTALSDRLGATLRALGRLSSRPATRSALTRLSATLASVAPTLRFLVPMQTRCNYLGVYTRNVNSTISEGDNTGTWFRTLGTGVPEARQMPEETVASARPGSRLHVNTYPSTGAPGQDGECEAGNETYRQGQVIGNVPGNQGRFTERTEPPPGVPRP